GHHVTNIILHTLNTLLLFWLLRVMTGRIWCSAIVAALFAVHPMHTESVVWVAERKDVLSTFFGLLTMHAYYRYSRKAHFDSESLLFWGVFTALVGMLGWLWYNQCFWYLEQVRWFQVVRMPPADNVLDRFAQQCDVLKRIGFLASPDSSDWLSQQRAWFE